MIKNKEAEILLLGLPNSGKSTLINALTKNKTSIIGSKPNTTRDKISKIVSYENDKNILISDLPGFLETPDEFNINYQNNLKQQISLVGMGSKFELWNLENWEKKQSGLQIPGEDLLEDLPAVLEEIPF